MTESSELPELPHGYNFRPVEKSDYSNLYIETLKVLTTVGDISAENFDEVYNHWLSLPDIYKPHICVEKWAILKTSQLPTPNKGKTWAEP